MPPSKGDTALPRAGLYRSCLTAILRVKLETEPADVADDELERIILPARHIPRLPGDEHANCSAVDGHVFPRVLGFLRQT